MNFNEYQLAAGETASYPDKGDNLIYPALGLAGEAGEAADKVKKFWRNQGITASRGLSYDDRLSLIKEIGDALWYIAALATELQIDLEDVAMINIAKLQDRKARNVIKSEGDNR
jgi:NTP pyrophosphatase (non-canonical NTP hydrolase)